MNWIELKIVLLNKTFIVKPGSFVYSGMGTGHYFSKSSPIPIFMNKEAAIKAAELEGIEFSYQTLY